MAVTAINEDLGAGPEEAAVMWEVVRFLLWRLRPYLIARQRARARFRR